jgi:predicted unusual protein kinase regulating ubiquinone biosynthesis (AarF/ABC1/UbiB family)
MTASYSNTSALLSGVSEMGFNRSELIRFFSRRPQVVAARLLRITRVLNRLQKEWERQEALPLEERTRGALVRKELSDLGPCFVKIGQTLSQRPDIVGDEAAEELKMLQTENEPFSDSVAMHMIATELGWTGPIAPGVVPAGSDPNGEHLFASISKTCIASASLGQVYRAELREDFDLGTSVFLETALVEEKPLAHGSSDADTTRKEAGVSAKNLAGKGRFVAVKVQRPEAVRQIALDWTCLALALESLEIYWRYVRPSGFEYSLGDIADEIASGIFQELNYIQESKNSQNFVDSLKFLGFVDAPTIIHQLTTPCVLTTSWVNGAHLRDLSPERAQDMVTMAVEACTASLVLTGYVHADPHEVCPLHLVHSVEHGVISSSGRCFVLTSPARYCVHRGISCLPTTVASYF